MLLRSKLFLDGLVKQRRRTRYALRSTTNDSSIHKGLRRRCKAASNEIGAFIVDASLSELRLREQLLCNRSGSRNHGKTSMEEFSILHRQSLFRILGQDIKWVEAHVSWFFACLELRGKSQAWRGVIDPLQ